MQMYAKTRSNAKLSVAWWEVKQYAKNRLQESIMEMKQLKAKEELKSKEIKRKADKKKLVGMQIGAIPDGSALFDDDLDWGVLDDF
tara:strand:- start:486 stop:743 length:258 start_codon:yes stop_codon:yes gene_type:complete